jgi:hypothetical protein
MSDHIPDATKMISDTPISDSTPHNVADLGMLCRRLERELNAANSIIRQQQLLDEENLRLQDHIKRLEEALAAYLDLLGTDGVEQGVAVVRGMKERIKRLEEALDKTSKAACKHIKQLESEVYALRLYGNKDCTAMADQALKEAKP